LTDLRQASPLLGSWFTTAGSRKAALTWPTEPAAEPLRELLLAGQALRDDDRSVMTELGFAAGMWNGQDVQVGLRVRCGGPAALQGMTSNTLVLKLPAAEGDVPWALYCREIALAILRAVVTVWQPAWCTWTNHRLRKSQERPARSWLAGQPTSRTGTACCATAEPIGAGLLLVADGDAHSASEATASAMRSALARALRPAL
jgi:hypothetical protein